VAGTLPPALPECRMSIAPSGHLTRVAEEWVDATSPLVRLQRAPRRCSRAPPRPCGAPTRSALLELPLPDVEGPAALPPGQVGRRVALDDPTPGRRLEPILGLT
jgi:hypothetical protein